MFKKHLLIICCERQNRGWSAYFIGFCMYPLAISSAAASVRDLMTGLITMRRFKAQRSSS
jgi:hypothetical protein